MPDLTYTAAHCFGYTILFFLLTLLPPSSLACYGPRMVVGLLTAFIALILSSTACVPPPEPPPPTQQRPKPTIITDLDSGIVFSLPPKWVEQATDHQRIFSGPEGTSEYFTTITLQTLSHQWNESPALALKAALENTPGSRARLISSEPRLLQSSKTLHPALWYFVELRHHREKFRRVGVIISVSKRLVEIQYTASAPLFESSFLVFESLLNSISIGP